MRVKLSLPRNVVYIRTLFFLDSKSGMFLHVIILSYRVPIMPNNNEESEMWIDKSNQIVSWILMEYYTKFGAIYLKWACTKNNVTF